jgi:hypothetical protein
MKELFLFKAVGSYYGGMAGATVKNAKEAFKKIRNKFSSDTFHGFVLHTENQVRKASYNSKTGDNWKNNEEINWETIDFKDSFKNGFTLFKTAWTTEEMIFCETLVSHPKVAFATFLL